MIFVTPGGTPPAPASHKLPLVVVCSTVKKDSKRERQGKGGTVTEKVTGGTDRGDSNSDRVTDRLIRASKGF